MLAGVPSAVMELFRRLQAIAGDLDAAAAEIRKDLKKGRQGEGPDVPGPE